MLKSIKVLWEKLCQNIDRVVISLLVSLIILSVVTMLSESMVLFLEELLGKKNGGKRGVLEFLGLVVSGLIAIYGLIAINRRLTIQVEIYKLEKRAHSQDQFKIALEHLNDNRESVRVASFYEFFDLAKDDRENYGQSVVDTLCKHLRQKTDYDDFDIHYYIDNSEESPHSEEVVALVDVLFGHKTEGVFDELRFDLKRANLSCLDLQLRNGRREIDFTRAFLGGATFHGGDLTDCKFQYAELFSTKFLGTNLHQANFTKADLTFAEFKNTNLSEVWIEEATMQYSSFENPNLHKTRFVFVDLCHANLEKMKISKHVLLWAKYNDDTKFPKGFNPEDHEHLEYVPPDDKNK